MKTCTALSDSSGRKVDERFVERKGEKKTPVFSASVLCALDGVRLPGYYVSCQYSVRMVKKGVVGIVMYCQSHG